MAEEARVTLPRQRLKIGAFGLCFLAVGLAGVSGGLDGKGPRWLDIAIASLGVLLGLRGLTHALAPGAAVVVTADVITIGLGARAGMLALPCRISAEDLDAIRVDPPTRIGVLHPPLRVVFLLRDGSSVAVGCPSFERGSEFASAAFDLLPPRA